MTPSQPPSHFSSLPGELIIHTICLLPALSDVFSLASCSSQLREISEDAAATIYDNVARHAIPHADLARKFLASSSDTSSDQISLRDLQRMQRSWKTVEKSMVKFEKGIVKFVRCMLSSILTSSRGRH